MTTCEICSTPLDASKGETITCNACEIARLRSLLASHRWLAVRGPFVADDIRADLAALEAVEGC